MTDCHSEPHQESDLSALYMLAFVSVAEGPAYNLGSAYQMRQVLPGQGDYCPRLE